MAVSQATVSPITNNDSLEIVTLKNLVALDLVEKNEALLKAFNLLDDSRLKINLGDKLSTETLQKLIYERTTTTDPAEDLKSYKTQLIDEKDPNIDVLQKLSAEFLQDGVPEDNTEELLKTFEKQNNVKVVFSDPGTNYRVVKPYLNLDENKTKDSDLEIV